MGYGGGSFDSGGGGYDGGGWDGGSIDWGYSGDYGGGDDGGGDYSGGSGNDCSKENRPRFLLGLAAFFLFHFGLVLILVGSLSPWERDVCGSITNLNSGEQRICQTTRTENVYLNIEATNVTAYRYATKDLPPTETRILHSSNSATAGPHEYLYFDFALSAGGTINFSYKFSYSYWSEKADLFLMTLAQFHAFRLHHETQSLFARVDVKSVDASYTVEQAGVYFLVVDNDHYRYVSVAQSTNITTSVFKVSNTTAAQVCSSNCTMKGVRSDEVVIVEYTGPYLFANATVHHGIKKLPRGCAIAFIVFSVAVALLLAAFIAALVAVIKQCKEPKSAPVADPPAETTTAGTEGSTPQEMTPDHDLDKPLIFSTPDEPVYYGTAPPDYA